MARPSISEGGIQNGASYERATRPANAPPGAQFLGAGIAPGSIFVVKGEELGPVVPRLGSLPYGTRLPDVEGGTELIVRSLESSQEMHAWLLYTSLRQVNAILPSSFPVGPAELIVRSGGETSEPVVFNVRGSAPGLFTVSENGRGSGVIQNYESPGSQPLNQLLHPARPGQYVILWGTGLGPVSGADNVPPPVGPVNSDVEVLIGGVYLKPDYAGRAPGYPGVDQINVRLPDDGSLPLGCYVDVSVRAGTATSPPVFLATAETSGTCRHPWNLPAEVLAELDAGRPIPAAQLFVGDLMLSKAPGQIFQAYFRKLAPWEVAVISRAAASAGSSPFPQYGCAVVDGGFLRVTVTEPVPGESSPPPNIQILDVGDRLHLDGPDGRSLELVKSESWLGYFVPDTEDHLVPDGFFVGGFWTLTAPGGDDIEPFSVPLSVPGPIRADTPAAVNRSEDLELAWNPEGFTESETMSASVISLLPAGEDLEIRRFKQAICSAPATAGSITIPARELSQLPATQEGVISFRARPDSRFRAEFAIPGIIYSAFYQSPTLYQPVAIQ